MVEVSNCSRHKSVKDLLKVIIKTLYGDTGCCVSYDLMGRYKGIMVLRFCGSPKKRNEEKYESCGYAIQ